MYKYIFNLLLFSFLIYLDELLGGDSYSKAIAPALVLSLAQFGLSAKQKSNAKAEQSILDTKLDVAKNKLDNVEFVNKLQALQVPKNIRGLMAAERAETSTVEALKDAGPRGVANIPKAVQASTDAQLALTEEDKRAQYMAGLEVQRQEQMTDTLNKQQDINIQMGEIAGLQQAGKEQRMAENAAKNSMAQAATGILTSGVKAANSGIAQMKINQQIGSVEADLAAGVIDQAQADAMIAKLKQGGAIAKATNPFTTAPNISALTQPVAGAVAGAQGATGTAGLTTGLNPTTGTGTGTGLVSANVPVTNSTPTMKYGLDVSLPYDQLNVGQKSAILTSNEYTQGSNQMPPGMDEFKSAYEQWHEATYPGQPVVYAGTGAPGGKMEAFEAALGY